jgi:hypothetical protein
MYAGTRGAGPDAGPGAGAPGGQPEGAGHGQENVVEADYEIVDDDKKKS